MKISQRAEEISPSLTRQLFNMAKNYNDVIDLTLGDPDVNTSDEIKKSACDAINSDKTKYSANAGLLQARQAVCKRIKNAWNVNSTPENIILTVGGMEALYLSLLSIIDPGDEVIIFAPYYVNYFQMIKMCGGTPVVIDSYSDGGFSIDEKTLKDKLSSKTVALIINSPNNPAGYVIKKEYLELIYRIAKENDLYIISDEVYRTLLYDDVEHESVVSNEDKADRVILIDSLSKEYSMTGYRAGFAYANEEIIKAMTKLQENVAACVSLPSQYAMLYAYENDIKLEYIKDEFEKRRNFLFEKLSVSDKLSIIKPQGTFYMFVNIDKTGLKSEEFALKLLEKEHIAVVPGLSYGENYDGYIRIAFTKDVSILNKAVERIFSFLGNI